MSCLNALRGRVRLTRWRCVIIMYVVCDHHMRSVCVYCEYCMTIACVFPVRMM